MASRWLAATRRSRRVEFRGDGRAFGVGSSRARIDRHFAISRNLLQVGSNVLADPGAQRQRGQYRHALQCGNRRPAIWSASTTISTRVPTPGAANSTIYYNQVEGVKFNHDRGFYESAFDVTITTDTAGATIRYTTDGSVPTATTGTVYTGPIHIQHDDQPAGRRF